jgi:hypothetical protein
MNLKELIQGRYISKLFSAPHPRIHKIHHAMESGPQVRRKHQWSRTSQKVSVVVMMRLRRLPTTTTSLKESPCGAMLPRRLQGSPTFASYGFFQASYSPNAWQRIDRPHEFAQMPEASVIAEPTLRHRQVPARRGCARVGSLTLLLNCLALSRRPGIQSPHRSDASLSRAKPSSPAPACRTPR